LQRKFPDRVPVVIDPRSDARFLEKRKFLVPGSTMTLGEFVGVIRRRVTLPPESAMFVFVEGGHIPRNTDTLSAIHARYKNAEGFLFLRITMESTFGQG
jgi:GABA(A) receptor-associated protein